MQFSSTPERNRHITERSVILGRFTIYAAIKSPYSHGGNPHRITQSLIAILAGLQIPFLCSETHELEGRNLGNPGSLQGIRVTVKLQRSEKIQKILFVRR